MKRNIGLAALKLEINKLANITGLAYEQRLKQGMTDYITNQLEQGKRADYLLAMLEQTTPADLMIWLERLDFETLGPPLAS